MNNLYIQCIHVRRIYTPENKAVHFIPQNDMRRSCLVDLSVYLHVCIKYVPKKIENNIKLSVACVFVILSKV